MECTVFQCHCPHKVHGSRLTPRNIHSTHRISLLPIWCLSTCFCSSDLDGIIFFSTSSVLVGLLLKNLAKLSWRATLEAKESVRNNTRNLRNKMLTVNQKIKVNKGTNTYTCGKKKSHQIFVNASCDMQWCKLILTALK